MKSRVEDKSRVGEDKHKRSRTLKIVIVVILALIVFLGSAVFIYGREILSRDTIYNGISINNNDLGAKTKEEAKEILLKNHDEDLKEAAIVAQYGNYSREISYSDLEAKYDYDEKIEKAYSIGREGSYIERILEIRELEEESIDYSLEMTYNSELVEGIVSEIESDLNRDPKNASIDYNGGNFRVSSDDEGLKVKAEELKEDILSSIGKTESVEIPTEIVEPNPSSESLRQIKNVIGEYETEFVAKENARNYNIWLSANSIDEKLVLPGEVFSFNNNTGLRSEENGYRESIVIVDGEFVPGIGGGVCQTSTTLYNAVKDANLDIVERHAHSQSVSYVPEGNDATVADHVLDFRFKNSNDFPVFIKTKVDIETGFINIKVYGK